MKLEVLADRVVIHQVDGAQAHALATFVWKDSLVVSRPYWMHLRSPDGYLLTRNFPPLASVDATDHETMHPGLWLSFSGLSGSDFWRNKAAVRREGWIEEPFVKEGVAGWSMKFSYSCDQDPNRPIDEVSQWRLVEGKVGHWLFWDSTFYPQGEAIFADQEEMGLGIRMATELSVKKGGTIRNSLGGVNEAGVWGKQAAWVDYSREINGRRRGIVMVPHRENFRACYFHARDYGLLVANPFGERSFTGQGDGTDRVVHPDHRRLRVGIYLYSGEIDPALLVEEYHTMAERMSRRSKSAIR
jgi:hypothetical protein